MSKIGERVQRRRSILSTLSWAGVMVSVSACGASGFDARDELRAVVEEREDLDPRWETVGVRNLADITVPQGHPEVAAVTWFETPDGERRLGAVSGSAGCDVVCVAGAEAWSRVRLTERALPLAIEDPCFNCGEVEHLSLVAMSDEGVFRAVDRPEVGEVIGEIDSPYEVMLAIGRSLRVRLEGDGWRAVDSEIVSDCDPFIEQFTMWSIDRQGGREQLTSIETQDDSCV